MVNRWAGQQCYRDPTNGGIDRRLHILRRGIDAARKIEGQRDLAGAIGTGGIHPSQSRDLTEMMFQRRSHRRFNHVRRCARIGCDNLDGGKIHIRKCGNRQQPIAEQAQHHHRNGQQRRSDRPQDERRGHGSAGALARRILIAMDDLHGDAGLQPEMSVGHHRFT